MHSPQGADLGDRPEDVDPLAAPTADAATADAVTAIAPRVRQGLAFPRAARIRSSKHFDLAFNAGRRASSNVMLVVARENGLGWSRLGLSCGRKFGPSHRRNRAKRLIKEAFRLERASLPAGYDYVVVPRKEGFPDHLDAIRDTVRRLFPSATRGQPQRPRPQDGRRKKRR